MSKQKGFSIAAVIKKLQSNLGLRLHKLNDSWKPSWLSKKYRTLLGPEIIRKRTVFNPQNAYARCKKQLLLKSCPLSSTWAMCQVLPASQKLYGDWKQLQALEYRENQKQKPTTLIILHGANKQVGLFPHFVLWIEPKTSIGNQERTSPTPQANL